MENYTATIKYYTELLKVVKHQSERDILIKAIEIYTSYNNAN